MAQLDLFATAAPVSGFETRDFQGFMQWREVVAGKAGRWRFEVPWFSCDDTTCTVVAADGSRRDGIPIDRQGRILINGRRYGREHWNH